MDAASKPAEQVRVGDELLIVGTTPHRVVAVDTYDGSGAKPGSFVALNCAAWRTATFSDGTAMTLVSGTDVRYAR